MTDPIEQARERLAQEAMNLGGWPIADWLDRVAAAGNAYEQAVLRYHPDVVRLVEAARDHHMWHDRDINDWNATHEKAWSEVHYRRDVLEPLVAALVPFTTEEESE